MANNIEKFLIEFGFKDKKVLKDLKDISKAYDVITASVKRNARAEQERGNRKLSTSNAIATKNLQAISLEKSLQGQADRVNKAYEKRANILNRLKASQARMAQTQTARVSKFRTSATFESASAGMPTQTSKVYSAFKAASAANDVEGMDRARSALRRLSAQARATKKDILSLKTAQNGLTDSTRNMIRGYASVYAAFASIKKINETGQGFEAVNSAMLAAMGSQQEAGKQMEFLDKLTSRLGMSLLDTADQYTKFIFASRGKLPTEEVNFLFQSMAEMGTVLGVSKERMKLSMNAIQQINLFRSAY